MRIKLTGLIAAACVGLLPLSLTLTSAETTFDGQTPLETLREAAKAGNPSAQDQLARRLLDGKAHSPQVERILQDAEDELQALWQTGPQNWQVLQMDAEHDPKSRDLMEKLRQKQEQLKKLKATMEEKETKEALELIDSAVAKKNIDSMLLLAWLCADGKRVPQNLERSVELNRQAAELGSSVAMCSLGGKYARGSGVPKDMQEAVKWLEKAYAKGNYQAGSDLADILTDGGLDGKDDGFKKNPQRAYVLGRALQLASERGSKAYQWGSQNVAKARQHLEPDQLLSAETEAEKEAERLKAAAGFKAGGGKPAIDLKNSGAITKQQWKAELGRNHPVFAAGGVIQMSKDTFIKLCGEPQKTQTVGDTVYWYYQCSDGVIQLSLDKGNLLAGIVAGQANDY